MATQGVVIKVGLAGAATTRREANATGKSVKGMGTDAEHAGKKFKLAEVSMRGFEKTSHRLRHTVRELAGAVGLAGLAFGTGEIVKSAINAQTSQAKLQATLKSSGISWRRYGKEIDETLEKQSLATGFQRADVSDSFANFIRTTGSVRKATKLNNIAFDVARTKNIGLANAQSILARVANGSYVGLKRLGIGITPVTVATDKLKASGRKYTAQQLARAKADDKAATTTQALAIVQRKFGGQSKAYTKTAQGSVDVLKASIEAIQERIGAVILPYVARGAQKLADLAQRIVHNWPKISATISKQAGKVKSALSPLLSFIDSHHKGIEKLAAGFAGIAASLALIKKVGHVTGLSRAASVVAKSPLGRLLGAATKADGSIKRPFYVVVLDKAPPSSLPKKIFNTVKNNLPAAAGGYGAAGGFGAAEAASLAGAAALPLTGILALALTNNKNLRTRGRGASSPSNPAGHVGFDQGAPFRRVTTAAVSGPTAASAAGAAILHGAADPFVIHNYMVVDGKVLAQSVTRAAKKKAALK